MAGKRRVLFIEKSPFVGGSVNSLYELVRGLDHERYEPIVLFLSPNPHRGRFQELGIQVETFSETVPPDMGQMKRDTTATLRRFNSHLARGYWLARDLYRFVQRDYPVAKRMANYIDGLGVDLVHHNNCLRTNRATILGASISRLPQVVHVRNLMPFSVVERHLARSVNAFIYISQAVEDLYRRLGIPMEKGRIIYNGFRTPQVQADATPLRTEFGLCNDDKVISNVGRIEWWKGQDYFIQATAEVVKILPNTKAILVGGVDATTRHEVYHHKLKQMVQDLHLSDHVIFGGFRSDVSQIMAMSDLVVHSSSEPEPFGRVIVEAMQVGRPVVATAAGGVLDIVENNVTGLTVPLKDSAAMASAMLHLLQHPDEAHAMGQRAQQEVGRRFSVEQNIHGVQALYDTILEDVGSQRSYVRA